MRKLTCFLGAFLLIAKISIAQKEASIWYFGHHCGLDFSSGAPVPLLDGKIDTDEGVASICNSSGKLLFYTEGTTIWDTHHNIMPNGTGLNGNFSSSQSAIIVPKIGDPSRYYVFTVDQLGGPKGFCYSLVNMNLNNGLGDVELKNHSLLTPVCEKLTAVRHCNGRDIWVIVHKFNSDAFYAYLVSPSGVSTTPVISHTGTFISNNNPEFAIGCMKASPDGKKLALANHHIGVDLDDFDNATGIVSNGRSLFLPTETYTTERGPYGVEFSPNSKLLYISADYFNFTAIGDFSTVLQYNVSLSSLATIQASKYVAYEQNAAWAAENFGTLQMGPDGKVYMAELGETYLSVINNPDGAGAACGFVHAQLKLPYNDSVAAISTYGLPSFIQSYWKPGFTFRGECKGKLMYFDYEKTDDVLSVKWDFGDPASGANNYSTKDSSAHEFTSEGNFKVRLIRYTACGSDTLTQVVSPGLVHGNLGPDTLLCGINQYRLHPNASPANVGYLWQDGSTDSSFTATSDGLYWVRITNKENGCSLNDSIRLAFRPSPELNLGPDLDKCVGDTVVLSANIPGASSLWNDGSSSDSLLATHSGQYWLEVNLNGCANRDSIDITFNPYPIVDLGKDTLLCQGEDLLLDAQNAGMQYQWQNNFNQQIYLVKTSGKYWVKVNNSGCIRSDSISVGYLQPPEFTLGNDTTICSDMSIVLHPKIIAGNDLNYLWSTGSSESSVTVADGGIYSLTLDNKCGTATREIHVSKGVCQLYVPSAFSPNGDGINDTFKALYGDNITDFDFQIYNAWGKLIFESENIKNGWDGLYHGQPQNAGLYVWMIKYKPGMNHSAIVMKGTVTLIR